MPQIADRLRATFAETESPDKIVSIGDLAEADVFAQEVDDLFAKVTNECSEIPEGTEPLHAVYIEASNYLALFQCLTQLHPDLSDYADKSDAIFHEWIAPQTDLSVAFSSFLHPYIHYDLAVAEDEGSISEVFLELQDICTTDEVLREAIGHLSRSYIALYELVAIEDEDFVVLENIYSGERFHVMWTIPTEPRIGQMLLTRLVAPLTCFEFEYWIILTCPTLFSNTTQSGWRKRLAQISSLPQTGLLPGEELRHLMKKEVHPIRWIAALQEKAQADDHFIRYRGYPPLSAECEDIGQC